MGALLVREQRAVSFKALRERGFAGGRDVERRPFSLL
jgi:hypothetical protein